MMFELPLFESVRASLGFCPCADWECILCGGQCVRTNSPSLFH